MFGLGRKKLEITKQQAMSARPVQLVNAQLTPMEGGGAQLKVPVKQTGWSKTLLRLPEDATKTFELDSIGLFVWEACDGKTSVEQIIRRLAKQHGLTLREVEVATVQFLQMLTKKGLIGMDVERESKR